MPNGRCRIHGGKSPWAPKGQYPLYFNTPYYVYPDGAVATEPYRVISA
jgi:hypothetical protein